MRKKCSKCGIEKDLCEFYFRKERNTYMSQCKECKLEKSKINWINKKQINPDYDKIRRKNREKNKPDEIKEYQKKRYSKNKQYWKNYREKNLESQKKYSKNYYSKNKNLINQYTNKWKKNKSKNDFMFRLINSCRSAVNRYLKNKSHRTFEIIGCTPIELVEHLEQKFVSGMCWDNHGKHGWHIDHIIPLSSAKNKEELYRLCHYTNLQPLWAIDNIKKNNKI